jgi:hypothetical protein
MNRALLLLFCWLTANLTLLEAQTKDPKDTEVWTPVPRVVTAGQGTAAPSDAIVLFDGTSMSNFVDGNGKPIQWELKDSCMTVIKGTGDIQTAQSFGDIQLHIEWRSPEIVVGEGQGRGNSGVFLQSRYEVQVLDNYNNSTYPNGQAGAIYKQYIPLVNACRAPGTWQTYDIIFIAPRFNKDGIKIANGSLTVLHNGVLIQNHVEIQGTSEYIGLPKNEAHGLAPIKLQDHGDRVSYRNIWIREL